MRTTTKYNQILPHNGTGTDNSVNGNYQPPPSPVPAAGDFDVIATEVRAIITKAYQADETNNVHS